MIELTSVIRDPCDELCRAIARDRARLALELGPIELEVSVVIETGIHAGGKARIWVVELRAQGNVDRFSTQRIKLVLTPRLSRARKRPLVSGVAVPQER